MNDLSLDELIAQYKKTVEEGTDFVEQVFSKEFDEKSLIVNKQLPTTEVREHLRLLKEECTKLTSAEGYNRALALMRNIDFNTLQKSGVFFTDVRMDLTHLTAVLRTKKDITANRWCIPVKDKSGEIITLVVYLPNVDVKYFFLPNSGYERGEIFYGMDTIDYRRDYLLVVEGMFCKLWADSEGLNSVGSFGTYLNKASLFNTIKRFKNRNITILDSDQAGQKAKKSWSYLSPDMKFINLVGAKDPDSFRKYEGGSELLFEAMETLLRTPKKEVTISVAGKPQLIPDLFGFDPEMTPQFNFTRDELLGFNYSRQNNSQVLLR